MDSTLTTIGTLVSEPELRFVGPKSVASFRLAINRRYQQDGEWKTESTFVDAECWGSLAENLTASVTKGDRVLVVGSLRQAEWEDKATGTPRTKLYLAADEVAPCLRWATVICQRNPRKDER